LLLLEATTPRLHAVHIHNDSPNSSPQISTLQVTRVRNERFPAAASPSTEDEPSKRLTTPPQRRGTIAELLQVVATSGWRSLFSGLSAALVGTTVSQGVYFYLYSVLRQTAVRRRNAGSVNAPAAAEVSVVESLLVAALAGMGNVLLTNPIWVVATRMQAHQRHKKQAQPDNNRSSDVSKPHEAGDFSRTDEEMGQNKHHAASSQEKMSPDSSSAQPAPSPLCVTREVYREYGLSGFWNGVSPSLVMVINPTIQYALLEWLLAARVRAKAKARSGRTAPGGLPRPSALEIFLLSAVAKAGATIVTYPLLTVKTRMMTAKKTDADMQYSSILDAVLQIAQREGGRGQFRIPPFAFCIEFVAWVLKNCVPHICFEAMSGL
jgi:solute carrier family 25 (peroxisomal adenine nucleotide transporter), member 17